MWCHDSWQIWTDIFCSLSLYPPWTASPGPRMSHPIGNENAEHRRRPNHSSSPPSPRRSVSQYQPQSRKLLPLQTVDILLDLSHHQHLNEWSYDHNMHSFKRPFQQGKAVSITEQFTVQKFYWLHWKCGLIMNIIVKPQRTFSFWSYLHVIWLLIHFLAATLARVFEKLSSCHMTCMT